MPSIHQASALKFIDDGQMTGAVLGKVLRGPGCVP